MQSYSYPPDDTWTVDSLPFPTRAQNAFRKAGIRLLSELCALSLEDLLRLDNLGRTTCNHVVRVLNSIGHNLSGEKTPAAAFSDSAATADQTPTPELSQEDLSIDSLEIPTRPFNVLRRAGILTLDQLCAYSARDLISLPNMGWTSLADVVGALARLGRHLADNTHGESEAPQPPPSPDASSLAGWAELLLEGQDPRVRDILILRAGLYSSHPQTLEEVGKTVGVTRERVRQLEKKGLTRLSKAVPRMQGFSGQVASLIRSAGGVARLSDLLAAISHLYPPKGVDVEAFARFSFPCCRDLVDWGEDLWAVQETNRDEYEKVVTTFENILRTQGMPLRAPDLLLQAAPVHEQLDPRFCEASLTSTSRLQILPGNWVILAEWKKALKARWVMVALREIGRPAHFTEISARLRELVPALADMSDHNIHATLGRLPEHIVRTDAGTFALKDWGIGNDRYIAGLLEEAFENIGGPATIEQLMSYVLGRKDCQEQSVRAFLEMDRRFLRLRRNLYTLAKWTGAGSTEEQLAEIRSVPLQPDWILRVLDHMVSEGRVSPEQLRALLTEHRQLARSDDYGHYLTRRGWAVQVGCDLIATEQTRQFYNSLDQIERLFGFAMTDANFQAYLILLFVEYLVRLGWTADGAERAQALLEGVIAPLRTIFSVMSGRLYSKCSRFAPSDEREMHLLQVIRAPAFPQVFLRWVEPVTGYNPHDTISVLNRLTARMGSFPAWPSIVHLGRIPRPEARLLLLSVALAVEDDAAVNYRRLEESAEWLGMEFPGLPTLSAELLLNGVFIDDRVSSRVTLLSPHHIVVRTGDVPTGVVDSLGSFRTMLWREGILVSHRDPTHTAPDVHVRLVENANEAAVEPANWKTLQAGESGAVVREVPGAGDLEDVLQRNIHLAVLYQLLIMIYLDDPLLIRRSGEDWVLQYAGVEFGTLGAALDLLLRTLNISVQFGGVPTEGLAAALVDRLKEWGVAEQVFGTLRMAEAHVLLLFEPPLVDQFLYGAEGIRSRVTRGLKSLVTEVINP